MIRMTKKVKAKIIWSGIISFVYHFPYFVYEWCNVFLLTKKLPFVSLILDCYSWFEATSVGFLMYFHLYIVNFISSNRLLIKGWILLSFLLVWFCIYILIRVIKKEEDTE
jgi:protein-S-isoprenylcysteine O-methyltransferase Ste14